MPDIAMCRTKECPLSDTCVRFLSKPGIYQSYTELKGGYDCDMYMRDETIGNMKLDKKILDDLNYYRSELSYYTKSKYSRPKAPISFIMVLTSVVNLLSSLREQVKNAK